MLYFGFRPFNFNQKNNVTIIKKGNGLVFNRFSVVVSDDLYLAERMRNGEITIEMILRSEKEYNNYAGNIFSFYNMNTQNEFLYFTQWKKDLMIYFYKDNKLNRVDAGNIFKRNEIIYLTVVLGKSNMTVYANGVQVDKNKIGLLNNLRLFDNCEMILGNSSEGKNQWFGEIYGLSVYNRSLDENDVLINYNYWKNSNSIKKSEQILLYNFKVNSENTIMNEGDLQIGLIIPGKFLLEKKVLFDQTVKRISISSIKDIVINLLGFIPLGFFIGLFFIYLGKSNLFVFLITCLVGFSLSLIIEYFQIYLPTRTSSIYDLVINVSGTFLGVMFAFIFKKMINKYL
jgi:hypothetical protein